MIRIATIFLCILLAAAAVGRYRAEVSVREARQELERLEAAKLEELRDIQMLRAEIAFLENPERLAKIATAKTDLRPSHGGQTVTARQFAAAFADEDAPLSDEPQPSKNDVILHALKMAQLADAR